MQILTKNFVVYGTGVSGESAINFLIEKGAKRVYVYDDFSDKQIPNTELLTNFIDIIKLDIECVILSPGVNVIDNKNIEYLQENNINYISEFYLGFLFSRGKKICVTGTNGKTTTVNLLYNIFKQNSRQNLTFFDFISFTKKQKNKDISILTFLLLFYLVLYIF